MSVQRLMEGMPPYGIALSAVGAWFATVWAFKGARWGLRVALEQLYLWMELPGVRAADALGSIWALFALPRRRQDQARQQPGEPEPDPPDLSALHEEAQQRTQEREEAYRQALEVLKLRAGCGKNEARKAYFAQVTGAKPEQKERITAAFDVICSFREWAN